jgi:hypothetical protein
LESLRFEVNLGKKREIPSPTSTIKPDAAIPATWEAKVGRRRPKGNPRQKQETLSEK